MLGSRAKLDCLFNPSSVAIIGVSTDENDMTNGGQLYLKSLLNCNFRGQIYPVNPKGGEVGGFKIYPNVKDIPGQVDYVVCCIPAPRVPQLVKDCAAKGVKAIHFFTSGFSETSTEEGKRLEAEICDTARRSRIRLVGPNCMGVYCPRVGLSFAYDFTTESGSVAFICHSGGNAIYFTRLAVNRGVRFSKVVSYGNACDVNESDLLEYFMTDPETSIIAIYIEGVKDGRRFKKVLEKAARQKPVVVMKGGLSEAGGRAADSHTGALAGTTEAWNGLLRQAEIIRVPSLEELADILVTFLYLPVPKGRRLGTLGIGGGASVFAADRYASAGLVLPTLPEEMKQRLKSFVETDAGLSLDNPVDLSMQYYTPAIYPSFRALADYSGVDTVIFHLPISIIPHRPSIPTDAAVSLLDSVIRVHRETSKPMAVVVGNLLDSASWHTAFECLQKCREARIPVYFSIDSAAKAVGRLLRYHERRAGLAG